MKKNWVCSKSKYFFVSLLKIIHHHIMNSNKTFIAFDGDGVRDSENSNLHIFNLLADWQKRYPNRFDFLDIDSINFMSQHDDLNETTIKTYLFGILEKADNLLVVVSKYTNPESKWLNWMISRAVNRYHLPVIVAIAGVSVVNDDVMTEWYPKFPAKVKKYIGRDSARMCYVPLTQTKLERSLGYFSVNTQTYPWNSTTIY